jgi:RHS repeat-associated protein
VALRENGQLRWLLGDHLGSTAYTVSGAAKSGEVRYKAFSATSFTSGLPPPTKYRFTGQREESGLGLYYYGARWYDPALGHFIQPDMIVPQPGNVLDYHRYSYTRFNPLKYTDPTGHCGVEVGVDVLITSDPVQCVGSAVRRLGEAAGSLAVGLQLFAATQSPQAGSVAERAVYMADQAARGASQLSNFGQFDPGNFNFDPNQFDPNKYRTVQNVGQEAHRQFRTEFRRQMSQHGREEKAGDFLTEKAIRDAKGNVVRINGQYGKPDAVDYKNHIIYDLKPWLEGGEAAIRSRYADQLELYKNLYQKAYGVMPTVQVVIYNQPSQ